MKRIFVTLILALTFPLNVLSFQTPDEGITLIKSRQGFVIVYNEGKLHFTIEFIGRELIPVNSERIFFKIDGKILQVQIANVEEFLQSSGKNQKESEILEKHREWEQNYLSDLLKSRLQVSSEKVATRLNREGLLWHFQMPEGMNQLVKAQVYVTSVIGDQVLTLNYTVEKEDTIMTAAKYLAEALNTLKVSNKPISVKAIQEEMRKQ